MKEKQPVAIPVEVGITDGQFTEITGEGIGEGLQVLVGVEETKKASSSATPLSPTGGGPGRR